jgi:hypothetical protein
LEKISYPFNFEFGSLAETIELPPIAVHLRNHINQNFQNQDFSVYVPGNAVVMDGYPVDLRMQLISVGSSDSYKVYFTDWANKIQLKYS